MANSDIPPELAKDLWRGTAKDHPFRTDLASRVPDDFYTAVGYLSKQWADVEFFCRSALATVMELDYTKILILTSGMQARTLLDTTRRAIHHILPEYAKEYDKTHDRLTKLHEYRNRVMHSNHLGSMGEKYPPHTIEWKVRLNKSGLSFSKNWKLAAHQVRRHALLARLLGLKLMDVEADARRLLEARHGSPPPSA